MDVKLQIFDGGNIDRFATKLQNFSFQLIQVS